MNDVHDLYDGGPIPADAVTRRFHVDGVTASIHTAIVALSASDFDPAAGRDRVELLLPVDQVVRHGSLRFNPGQTVIVAIWDDLS